MGHFAHTRAGRALGTMALAGALLAALSCASGGQLTTVIPASGVRTLMAGSARVAAGDKVIRSAEDLTALWAEAGIKNPPPGIDFSTTMVVATAGGCQPNSCYSARIVRFARSGEGAQVVVEDAVPHPACMCASVMTCPYHIAAVPRVDGQVQFEHRPVSAPCRKRRRP